MEEEYKKSLEIFKGEKEKLINQLKDENSSIDAKSKIYPYFFKFLLLQNKQ